MCSVSVQVCLSTKENPTRLAISVEACLLAVSSQLPLLLFHIPPSISVASTLLVLLVVVDVGVPEKGLHRASESAWRFSSHARAVFRIISSLVELRIAYLVTVAPEVVLGPDVLEGVLDSLLQGSAVRPVLPVLGPEAVGVDTRQNDGGDHDATFRDVVSVALQLQQVLAFGGAGCSTRWKACARCLKRCMVSQLLS